MTKEDTTAATLPLVNRRTLATVLGCSVRHVGTLEADQVIAPKVRGKAGRGSWYALQDVVPPYLATLRSTLSVPGDKAARTRRDLATAKLTELRTDRESRTLLPADEVEKVWAAEVAAVRTVILASYTSQADRVFRAGTIDGLAGVERELKALAYEILRELADPKRPPTKPTTRGGKALEAA